MRYFPLIQMCKGQFTRAGSTHHLRFLSDLLTFCLPSLQAESVHASRKLTKTSVESLPAGDTDVIYWDTFLPGLGVRVKPSGTRSYVVQYRNRQTGRSRRKTIGRHGPLMTFSQARDIAKGLLSDVVRGNDPVAEGKAYKQAPSVADLADQYLESHATPKKRPKSVKSDEAALRRFILPRLGGRKVAEITGRDIQQLHTGLRETPYLANRTLALLSTMFGLSVRWGYRPNNPARGIAKFHEEKRDRWLSDDELARLLTALQNHPNKVAANAIRLQLLTGARIGEVLSARWENFDVERGVWTKPSHHTKQKRTEHLPLSKSALELLLDMRNDARDRSAFLFPGRKPDKPIADLKRFWNSVTASAGLEDYRIHDNRHTHASHLVSSGISLAIVGRLLGHTNPMTTQRYPHLADDPLRAAAEVFGQKMSE